MHERPAAASDDPTQGIPDASQLETFDTIRMTPLRLWTLILLALGEFVDGYDLIVIGGALLLLKPQLHLSASQTGLLGAGAFFGAAAGLLAFGELTDRIGRRNVFLYNFAFFVVFAVLSAFVTNYAELLTVRILLGAVIGADIATSMTFLAEISPRRSRGGWTGAMPQIMWTIGAIVSLLVALVLFDHAGQDAWRWMLGLGAAPALIVLLGRRTIPESPRWLLAAGRAADAEAAMRKLGLTRTQGKPATVPASTGIPGRPLRPGTQGSYLDIFRRPYTAQAWLAIVIVGFTPLLGAPASVLAPYVLHYVGLLGATAALKGSLFTWIGGLAGSVVAFFTIDRIGRLASAAISTFGAFICLTCMALFTGQADVFVALYIVLGFLTWFGASSFWALPTELLPTHLRARSQGLGQGLTRSIVGATTWMVPAAISALGFKGTIVLLGASGIPLGSYALYGRRYEPKQKTLEQIAPVTATTPAHRLHAEGSKQNPVPPVKEGSA